MSGMKVLEVALPADLVRLVEGKVESGDYANASDVLRDGIEALAAEDAAIERWLAEEVVPTYDAVDRNPARAVPIADVRRRIEVVMAGRTQATGPSRRITSVWLPKRSRTSKRSMRTS